MKDVIGILKVLIVVSCTLAIAFYEYNQKKVEPPKVVVPIDTMSRKDFTIASIMPIIIELESGGDTLAKGKSNDLGMLQITPICVKDYNIHSGDSLKHSQMTNPILSKRVYDFQMQRQYDLFCKKNGFEPTEAQVVAFWNGRNYNQSYVNKYFQIKARD